MFVGVLFLMFKRILQSRRRESFESEIPLEVIFREVYLCNKDVVLREVYLCKKEVAFREVYLCNKKVAFREVYLCNKKVAFREVSLQQGGCI